MLRDGLSMEKPNLAYGIATVKTNMPLEQAHLLRTVVGVGMCAWSWIHLS